MNIMNISFSNLKLIIPQVGSLEEQRQIEQLLHLGFEWEEAVKLLDLRNTSTIMTKCANV